MSDNQPFTNEPVLVTGIRALPATAGGANFEKEDRQQLLSPMLKGGFPEGFVVRKVNI